MAWIKSKTTAHGHDSPFCVDENGNPFYLRHMAADCGWEEQTARNVVAKLHEQGRARIETVSNNGKAKRGVNRIWYCADVSQAREERRTKGDTDNSVQSY